MNSIIADIEGKHRKPDLPGEFQVGDDVDVHVRIREGDKERTQVFTGTVIRIKSGGKNIRSTFTVRRIVAGEGVERVFPFHSRRIEKVVVRRPGKVRRAKLYYLRDRVGKATKVKERRVERPRATEKKLGKRKAKQKARAEAKAAARDKPGAKPKPKPKAARS